jgi:hypothetical protein
MSKQVTNSKQLKTLIRIFMVPTPNDILWQAIESLLNHVGCTIKYRGNGSKLRITKDSAVLSEHRPHPSNQTPPFTVERIKKFLAKIGVTP